jgi:predicted enzyme related to lactoylglutathione lyase
MDDLHLDNVIIATHDKARLLSFYHDVLGLPHATTNKLISNGILLHPMQHSAVQGPPAEPYRVMLTFTVADIHATAERLHKRGVVFVREPEREPWGGWVATFCDPDGNYLQLMQVSETDAAS